MDAMRDSRSTFPEIELNDDERARETVLRHLGAAYQEEMEAQGNPCALKGGTATRAAFPGQKASIGWDWLKRGTVAIAIRDNDTGKWIDTSLDYRKAGSRESIPSRIDLDKCRPVHGMNVYRDRDLVERKLNTLVGSSARHKPRDIYDAGWLVHKHPELISEKQSAGLKSWLAKLSPEQKENLKEEMRRERVIGRTDVDQVWSMLEKGIQRLHTSRTKRDATGKSVSAEHTTTDPKNGDDLPAPRVGGNPAVKPPRPRPPTARGADRDTKKAQSRGATRDR